MRDEASPFVQMLWERGSAHEQELVQGINVPFLDWSNLKADEKEAAPRAAIVRREPLIFGGRLAIDELLGEPDLLRLENGGQVAVDIKSGAAYRIHGGRGSFRQSKAGSRGTNKTRSPAPGCLRRPSHCEAANRSRALNNC